MFVSRVLAIALVYGCFPDSTFAALGTGQSLVRSETGSRGLVMFPGDDRRESEDTLSLRPTCSSNVHVVPSARDAHSNREHSEFDHGGLLEWTRHSAGRLEHGFVVTDLESPCIQFDGEHLRLDLELPSAFSVIVHDERAALFTAKSGVYSYSGLFVWDAAGRTLDAEFKSSTEENRFAISISAQDIVLPIVIDPLVRFEARTIESPVPAATGRFGQSLSVDADSIIVGAIGEQAGPTGAAHIFTFTGATWALQQTLANGSSNLPGDQFGASVDIVGDLAVVGAPLGDKPLPPVGNSGAIHVYGRSGTVWGAPLDFHPPTSDNEQLGTSVAIDESGLRIAAGATIGDGLAVDSGLVYIYSGNPFVQEDILMASDGENGDDFGRSVSIHGSTVVVGAPLDDDQAADAGAVYVYDFDGTAWSETTKLFASDPEANDLFGTSVSLEGDVMAVGAPFGDGFATCLLGGCNEGAAYVFRRGPSGWAEESKVTASDGYSNAFFGTSVDLRYPELLVGASRHSNNLSPISPGFEVGAAYLFRDDLGGWLEHSRLSANEPDPSEQLGTAVGLSASQALVSAPNREVAGNAVAGSVLSFDLPLNLQEFCFGDGGTIPGAAPPGPSGCTLCPCGNNADFGTYGGCTNSAGRNARLRAVGIPSISVDTLHFDLTGATSPSLAVLNSADNATPNMMSNPCFGQSSGVQSLSFDGLRCVAGNVQRHGNRATDINGDVVSPMGWGPPAGPPGGILMAAGFGTPGQTRHFQVVYREDDTLSCMRGLNTSNGVRVTIVP